MSNNFFLFKKFKVVQELNALKVCTESCLFGAIVKVLPFDKVLDIGTGTGLLSLMIAQKDDKIKIDSVEIDELSAKEAIENILESPFKDQIEVFHQSIQYFTHKSDQKYSLIISNPPFFQDHLKPDNIKDLVSKHTDLLDFKDLLDSVCQLLDKKGRFYLLLPPNETKIFVELALNKNLYVTGKINIANQPNSKIFRVISIFEFKEEEQLKEETIFIKGENNQYSQKFINLLKDYYTIF